MIQLCISKCWLILKGGGGGRPAPCLSVSWFSLLTQGINNAELVNGNCSQKGVMCAGDGTGKMARTHTPPSRQPPGLLLRNGAEQHHKTIQFQLGGKKKSVQGDVTAKDEHQCRSFQVLLTGLSISLSCQLDCRFPGTQVIKTGMIIGIKYFRH